MSGHLLRSHHHHHHDGSGDQARGSPAVSLFDMIKRAHGTVRTSIGLVPAAGTAGHVLVMDGYDAEDAYDAEVATLSGHLAAVEAVLYPVARKRLDGGRAEVAAQQRLSRRIERLMRLIEGHFYGEVHAIDMRVEPLQRRLAQLVEDSRRSELDLARRLDATLTTAQRHAVAQDFTAARKHAPTRPHPYTPHTRGLARFAFHVCSMWDRAFDVMDNRKVPGSAPRRRLTPLTLWDRYVLAPSFQESIQGGPQAPPPASPGSS
jgi:hypothetical protein